MAGLVAGLGLQGCRAKANAAYTAPDDERFDLKRFPYPVVTVPGEHALAEWRRLRQDRSRTPVIIGNDFSANRVLEGLTSETRSPAAVLAAAGALRFPDDLAVARKRDEAASDDPAPEPELGDWPRTVTPHKPLLAAMNYTQDRPARAVYIALLPTTDPTAAPAWLKYGGWNECPSPEHHVAALRRWRDLYGATVVAIAHDTIELESSSRPKSRDQALALAREQYLYCADIVDQGAETLSNLAAGLMAGDWWFFWWD